MHLLITLSYLCRDKFKKQVEKNAKAAGIAIAAFSATAATALAAITVSTVRTASEISRLSQLTGASAQDFQRYSAGAKALGIEQEKLADKCLLRLIQGE